MPPELFIVLPFALLAVALAASWRWRWSRQPNWHERDRLSKVGLTLAMVAWLALAIAGLRDPERFWPNRAVLLLAYGAFVGLLIHQWRHARQKAAQEPPPAPALLAPRRPTFLWQAGLILLPVVLMTVIGFVALMRDRAAVENEARQRAEELIERLQIDIGSRVASIFSEVTAYSEFIVSGYRALHGRWPEGRDPATWQVISNNYAGQLARWHERYSPIDPLEVLPNDLQFDVAGRVLNTRLGKSPPEPPDWFVSLAPDQSTAWTALNSVLTSHGLDLVAISNHVAEFIATHPAAEAIANARFLQLRSESGLMNPADAIAKLRRFKWEDRRVLTEGGLPLGNLIFAEIIKRSHDLGPTEALWQELEDQLQNFPGYLTPFLLDQVESLVATNPSLRDSLTAWRNLWRGGERARGIGEAIQRSGKLQGITTTNLWVEHDGGLWFCTLQASESVRMTRSNGVMENITNSVTQARFHQQRLVERIFTRTLREVVPLKQSHFGYTVELEGQPLALPPLNEAAEPLSPENVLAVGEFRLSLPGRMLLNHPQPGQEPELGPEFETLPSHPRFVLRIHLADRARLFVAYRQRLWLFGGLIFASAGAAFVGVFMARRSFLREQRLNELKTNFVSSVSHELRAPIASVRLMAENLERGKVTGADKLAEYTRFIGQECRRLSALIENVLDFGRIEQGRKQYEFEPTDLGRLVADTVRLMQPYAEERGVKLELEGRDSCRPKATNNEAGNLTAAGSDESTGASVRAESPGDRNVAVPLELNLDGRAIQQALVNLIDNAIKHSPSGAEVAIALNGRARLLPSPNQNEAGESRLGGSLSLPDAVTISVTDHGPGIPREDHEKIFQRFYRRGSELRRETPGIGIGLSIVKHIVEAHGGRVWVGSEPGKGSRLVIELRTNR